MKSKLALTILLPVVALAVTGCGGGNSAADSYANRVCTAIGSWATTVKQLEHGPRSVAAVKARLKQFETITTHLASQIKALPAPNTSDARATTTEIDKLATQIGRAAADMKITAANVGRHTSPSQALAVLAQRFQIQQITTKATLATLQAAGGPLGGAFGGSDACKQLG
jgi:hypothetical protein